MLIVPSAVMPQERNLILNPLHPDFAKIVIQKWENLY
ncbi:MAG: RES family NAD+ phosphorylase [Pseudomonadota bacterium]